MRDPPTNATLAIRICPARWIARAIAPGDPQHSDWAIEKQGLVPAFVLPPQSAAHSGNRYIMVVFNIHTFSATNQLP
jgi:hypothetical protein